MPTELTADEVIAYLKRSQLPTVLTEGRRDYLIYRDIEESLSEIGVSLMPVGGRSCLLSVFERRSETGRANEIAFIADRDLWVMTQVPDEYVSDCVAFTNGYSIENDLYQDGDPERLLSLEEKQKFFSELREFIRWYAFAVHKNLNGSKVSLNYHPNEVLKDKKLAPEFIEKSSFSEPPNEIFEQLMQEYKKLLRGKSLIKIIMRHLNYPKRPAKHSYDALLEHCASIKGSYMKSIRDSIENFFKKA